MSDCSCVQQMRLVPQDSHEHASMVGDLRDGGHRLHLAPLIAACLLTLAYTDLLWEEEGADSLVIQISLASCAAAWGMTAADGLRARDRTDEWLGMPRLR